MLLQSVEVVLHLESLRLRITSILGKEGVLITCNYTPQATPNYAYSIQIWATGLVSDYM